MAIRTDVLMNSLNDYNHKLNNFTIITDSTPFNKYNSVVATNKNNNIVGTNKNNSALVNNTIDPPSLYWDRNKYVNKIMLMAEPAKGAYSVDNNTMRNLVYMLGVQPLVLVVMATILSIGPVIDILLNGDNYSLIMSILGSGVAAYMIARKFNGYILYKMFSGNIVKEYNYSNVLNHREAGILTGALNYYGGTLEGIAPDEGTYNTIHRFLDDPNIATTVDELHEIKDRLIYNIRRTDDEDILYREDVIISNDYIYNNKSEALYVDVNKNASLILSSTHISALEGKKVQRNNNGNNEYYEKLFKKLKKMDSRLANLNVIYYNLAADSEYVYVFDVIVNELETTYSIIREFAEDGISDGAVEAKMFTEIVDVVSPKLDEIMDSIRSEYLGELDNIKDNLNINLNKN